MTVRQVYFIGSIGGPIKIGVSDCPERRVSQLQTGCPHRIHLLAKCPGDESNERALHHQFGRSRLGGEWFMPSPELLSLIWKIAASGQQIILPSREADTDLSEFRPLVEGGVRGLAIFLASLKPEVSSRVAKRVAGALIKEIERRPARST